jgi:hypothetical protein
MEQAQRVDRSLRMLCWWWVNEQRRRVDGGAGGMVEEESKYDALDGSNYDDQCG